MAIIFAILSFLCLPYLLLLLESQSFYLTPNTI